MKDSYKKMTEGLKELGWSLVYKYFNWSKNIDEKIMKKAGEHVRG